MDGPSGFRIRPATEADMRPAFAVFRRSLYDYLHRSGMVESPIVTDAMLEAAWAPRAVWIEHLWRTAAENWVAVEADRAAAGDRITGWALSTERDGSLELTHFFVDPATQSQGVGRVLLERAIPLGRGRHRSILGTQDPPALALYLKFGVRHATTAVDFEARPAPATVPSDLEFERLAPDPADAAGIAAAVDLIAGVELALLSHRRDIDTVFLLGMRPAWIARRGGTIAGFAFGAQGDVCGPIGALDPDDMPALLALVEREAAAAGIEALYFTVPLANDAAVRHLLGRGFRIDRFFANVLVDDPSVILFDRWIITGPEFIL
jgi:GNAT superfamily N-acetyltransferase